MSKPVKLVLDGTLFAECEMHGANRDGMKRLAEEVTAKLVVNKEMDVSFASTVFMKKYDTAFKKFVSENYPENSHKIFSKKAPFFFDALKWRGLFRKESIKSKIDPYYKEINSYDLFHSYYYPFSPQILKNKIKRSITYLDIIPLRRSGYLPELVDRTKLIVQCIKTNHAISISEYSKLDLLDYEKDIDPARISVVPLAASQEAFYRNTNKNDWKRIKEKYALPDNYFLCVSGNDGRKNVPHIIKSFSKFMMQEKPQDLHFVLTGNGSHHTMLENLDIPVPVKEKIFIPPSFIDSEDLAVIYSNGLCFFFMSLYEGFGLPALEAMQCGIPTVTSDTTSLPEVVGDGGIMLAPMDEDALASVMTEMYNDSALREKYSEAGLKRAAEFSWQRCADEYAEIFKKITSTSQQ